MATRSGSVDPGMLLWLSEQQGLSGGELADALERRWGFGLAGSANMREIVSQARDGHEQARLALDVYIHRLRGGIAAMAAALDGLDVLVFTGGVGEHSPTVRSKAAGGLGFLGVTLDSARNQRASADGEIGTDGARVRALVLTSREICDRAAGQGCVGGPVAGSVRSLSRLSSRSTPSVQTARLTRPRRRSRSRPWPRGRPRRARATRPPRGRRAARSRPARRSAACA